MGNNTLNFEISEMIPKINDLTQKEKNFINDYFDEIGVDFEMEERIDIETNPVEFADFLIYSLRRFYRKES